MNGPVYHLHARYNFTGLNELNSTELNSTAAQLEENIVNESNKFLS